MSPLVYVVCFFLSQMVAGDIATMTTANGTVDLAAVVSTVASLQTTVDTLKTELNSSNSQLATALKKLTTTEDEFVAIKMELRLSVSSLETEIAKLQHMGTNNTQDEIQSLKTSLNNTNIEVDNAVASLMALKAEIRSNLSALTSNMAASGQNHSSTDEHTGRYVAFQASPTRERSGWTILDFQEVDYNEGGAYNKKTGYFTAPMDGTYLFWASILINGANANVYINKGTNRLAAGYGGTRNRFGLGTATAMAVAHLNAKDMVHFYFDSNSDSIHNAMESFIGGALLHADSKHA